MSISAKRSLKGALTSKTSTNGDLNIGVVQAHEVDPTVPDWAKQPEKPTYTAEEVGAQAIGDYALKSDIPKIPESVLYIAQELSLDQQAQARKNIGAADVDSLAEVFSDIDDLRANAGGNTIIGVIDSHYYNYRMLNEERGATMAEIREAALSKDKDIVIRLDLDNWQGTLQYLGLVNLTDDGSTYKQVLLFSTIKMNNGVVNTSDNIVSGDVLLEYWYTSLESGDGMPPTAFMNCQFAKINLAPGTKHTGSFMRVNEDGLWDVEKVDIIQSPVTASVGQTLVVKAVDDTGKPTEWETVDAALKSELSNLQPKGDYALKSDIPDVPIQSVNGKTGSVELTASDVGALPVDTDIPDIPETTESDMYLITDNDGNRTWVKQLAYVRQEEQVLIAETEITDTSTNVQPELFNQLIPIKNGDIVKVTFNGTVYEAAALAMGTRYRVAIPSVCSFILTGVGKSTQFYNLSGQTGVISATAITDKYYTIDPNFLPTASMAGQGYSSVILTPFSLAKADGSYSVSANYAVAANNAAFAANMGNANGMYSFATGRNTNANGIYSRADGFSTIASGEVQHAEGKYNIEDTEEKYAHIIGNGTANDARSNAHTVDWEGTGWFANGLKVGGTGQDDEAAQEVALKSDIPAPEGMWEEIEVFELSESTQGPINRSMDLDGAPYNFKRLRIEMTLSKGNVGTISVLVGLSDKTNKIIVHLPDAMSEEETLCNNLCLDIRNGALEITGIIGAPNTSVLTGQVAYPTLYTTNGVITDITIGATAAMGADSLFSIKAVRA